MVVKAPKKAVATRLKQVAHINPGRSEAARLRSDDSVTFLPMEAIGADGLARFREPVPASTVWKGFTYFRRGDILLAKITPCFENGKTALLDRMPTEIGFGSTEFHVLRPGPQVVPEYLHHVIRTDDFRRTGADNMSGAAGQQRIPTDFVAEYQFPLPPLDEQRAIARFLDRKSRRIARFIHARQRMIALLNEQKQAIIHQAVTRGLDPDIPLKPSGIDWLGDIPAHWRLSRLKSLFREVDDRSITGSETLLSVSHLTGVTRRSEKTISMFLAESNAGHKVCEPEDLVVNTMWAWMGALGIAQESGLVSPSYGVYRLRSGDELRTGYAELLLRQKHYIDEYNRRSSGITSSRMRLYPDDFLGIPVALPPFAEQERILTVLDSGVSAESQQIDRYKREIELLREYRTRLIADVVTGKLDIRDHPDAAEDALDDFDDVSDIEGILGTDPESPDNHQEVGENDDV